MLDLKLKKYLNKYFPQLFSYDISISIENGWFPLLLITCRYIHCYCRDQNKQSQIDPDKYKPVTHPIFTYIGKNKQDGLLNIKIEHGNEKILDFLEFIKFLSGYICCKSSSFYKNVCIEKNSDEKVIINEKFITENDYLLFYIDNSELLSIFNDLFLKNEHEQLEFDFKL